MLQADAFAGYDRLFSTEREGGPLTEAVCWAHARRKIHDVYISTQTATAEEALKRIGEFSPLNLRPKEKQQYVNRKTRQALLARNQQLQAEISELRDQLAQNTLSLIGIVKAVKINTVIPVESLLAKHMIRELHKSS